MITTTRRPPSPSTTRARAAAWLMAGVVLASAGWLAAQAPTAAQTPTPPAAGASDLKITLKWTTASEVDNYGYFVWRGDGADGPWTQMNKKAIPGAGNSDTPSSYVWEDHDVELGRTYYYWLESISVQGAREKFSPVLSRTCCGSASGQRKPEPTPTPQAN